MSLWAPDSGLNEGGEKNKEVQLSKWAAERSGDIHCSAFSKHCKIFTQDTRSKNIVCSRLFFLFLVWSKHRFSAEINQHLADMLNLRKMSHCASQVNKKLVLKDYAEESLQVWFVVPRLLLLLSVSVSPLPPVFLVCGGGLNESVDHMNPLIWHRHTPDRHAQDVNTFNIQACLDKQRLKRLDGKNHRGTVASETMWSRGPAAGVGARPPKKGGVKGEVALNC